MRSNSLLPFLIVGLSPPGYARAQSAVMLRPPISRVAYEFTHLGSLRELPDRRVIVVDRGGRSLFLIDPASGRTRPIGRQGEGPGEYRYPALVVSLGVDSSLVVDTQLRRWLVLAGDRVVRTMGADNELVRLLGADVVGADSNGRIAAIAGEPQGSYIAHDAVRVQERFVVAGRVGNAKLDTIGTLSVRRGSTIAVRGGTTYFLSNPLAIDEQGLLMSDGWLAIARLSPYRVDWRSPASVVVSGKVTGEVMPRVAEVNKQNAIAREWFIPGYTGPHWKPADFSGWPAEMPPFLREALLAAPDGRLLVERPPATNSRQTIYDIFDRSSARVGQLILPSGGRLIGFGERTAYVAQRTDDDLEILSIHPWP